jgi:hypothetical protein
MGTTLCGITGCGTLIHSERRNQPHSNQIDWKIAALDGLGLLLFFVPGVVAFVVDFSTGAIYLPVEPHDPRYGKNLQQPPGDAQREPPLPNATPPGPRDAAAAVSAHHPPTSQELRLKQVVIPREELQQQRIEQVVMDHTGKLVSLNTSQTRLSMLPSIEKFDEQASRHRADHNFGVAVQSFFARLHWA